MKLVTAAEMRAIEDRAAEVGLPSPVLMEYAGLAVAGRARAFLGGNVVGRRALVLVGPGNNGGDGLVIARHVHDWGARVQLYLWNRRLDGDENFARCHERGIPYLATGEDPAYRGLEAFLTWADVVFDALLGTGRARPIGGELQEVLDRLNGRRAAPDPPIVVAVDLPTGVDADTGEADPRTPDADLTVTLGYPKLGLFAFPAAARLGRLEVGDLHLPDRLAADVEVEVIDGAWATAHLPLRPASGHKGTFGKVLVVAGSIQYLGAPYLACEGAQRAGAGLVTLAVPAALQTPLAAKLIESTFIPVGGDGEGHFGPAAVRVVLSRAGEYDAVVLGPGLGQDPETVAFVGKLWEGLAGGPAVLVDADGLNALSRTEGWWQRGPERTVLTPHPGEMARLTGLPAGEIAAARLRVVRESARRWGRVVVLKGAFAVAGAPDGQVAVNPVATAALASAGTGDVLAGAIGGLLAQGLDPFAATRLGLYLHGTAGVLLASQAGPAGVVASDLLTALPEVMQRLRREGRVPGVL